MRAMRILDELCETTGTELKDWEFIDGPVSRSGVDYWLRHKPTGKEAYVNDDQGHISVDCDELRHPLVNMSFLPRSKGPRR